MKVLKTLLAILLAILLVILLACGLLGLDYMLIEVGIDALRSESEDIAFKVFFSSGILLFLLLQIIGVVCSVSKIGKDIKSLNKQQ
jgi:hypothetical protein